MVEGGDCYKKLSLVLDVDFLLSYFLSRSVRPKQHSLAQSTVYLVFWFSS